MSRSNGAATNQSRDQAGAVSSETRFASEDNRTCCASQPLRSRLLTALFTPFVASRRVRRLFLDPWIGTEFQPGPAAFA
jgi:hypothetical protein